MLNRDERIEFITHAMFMQQLSAAWYRYSAVRPGFRELHAVRHDKGEHAILIGRHLGHSWDIVLGFTHIVLVQYSVLCRWFGVWGFLTADPRYLL